MMATMPLRIACLGALVAALFGCSDTPRLSTGEQCVRTSDCEEPLVCSFSRCRRQCDSIRDCALGQDCVLDSSGLGSCQDERCMRTSDCDPLLVCLNMRCTNACREDRDCLEGKICVTDPTSGESACEAPVPVCVYNSDCGGPQEVDACSTTFTAQLVCTVDQICAVECCEERDCDYPRVCSVEHRCVLPDGGFL